MFTGHLDALLLAALEPGPRHGVDVADALRVGSGARVGLASGTLSPALRRLKRAGFLVGDWSHADARPQRSYELTAPGRASLAGQRSPWREFVATVTALLEPAMSPPVPRSARAAPPPMTG